MITFNYQLSASWNRDTDSRDFSTLNAADLRYSTAMGDITMVVNEHDFSAQWGWIPIIDFAVSLRHIAAELAEDNCVETEYPFTESEAVIRFKRVGDKVLISASYVRSTAQVSVAEFTNAVTDFAAKVAQELGQRYPLLLKNEAFIACFPNA